MKYIHNQDIHNTNAANEIVPIIIDLFSPKNVADIGCGTGTFLNVFKSNGISDVIGIDGSWVDWKLLLKNINEAEFFECDFEKGVRLKKRYDICICLEVAEHISPYKSSSFISDLSEISNVIIFSAAIPFQGGQNHLNEQWIDYWQDLFKEKGYSIYDGLRELIWDNKNVDVWYKSIYLFLLKIQSFLIIRVILVLLSVIK